MHTMTILPLLIAAVFIFLGFLIKSNFRQAFIQSYIVICFIAYLFCELFSINNGLTALNIVIGWLVVLLGSGLYLLINRAILQNRVQVTITNITINGDAFSKKLIGAGLLFIVLPLFLLAIFVPPNNWDSMAYHMPRVMHWIQDKNIYPYPTHIYRQVLTSPLSEYVILNLQVVSGGDTFANLIQFFAFIGLMFAISLMAQLMGIKAKGQLFILLMVISLPMILFQATTTQTDLLASFFFMAFIYFTMAFIKKQGNEHNEFFNFIFIALSLSLGILTKYNVAIFAFLVTLYLLYHIVSSYKTKQIFYFITIAGSIAAIVLLPFIAQNIHYFGSATGQGVFDNNASIISDKLSVRYLISNNIKLLADFISIPVDAFNKLIHSFVTGTHRLIGVSENEPGNNWAGEAFTINNHLNEDTAGSLFHFVFILLSLFLIAKSKFSRKHLAVLCYFIFSFSLFSLLFRYSAFNFRLLLPLVTLLVAVCGYILFKKLEHSKWINRLMILFFLVVLLPVYFNRAKPIIANPIELRRTLLKFPKGDIDANYLKLIPEAAKAKIISKYNFENNRFILKSNLSKTEKRNLYTLQDSIGLFNIDNKLVFQKTRLENYFAQQPFLKSNMDSLFTRLPNGKSKINLKTEFDSFEYLIWIYAANKFNNDFYIGYDNNEKYVSNASNLKPVHYFEIQLVDSSKNWNALSLK